MPGVVPSLPGVLPLPRRRLDPEAVRDRLRALAEGRDPWALDRSTPDDGEQADVPEPLAARPALRPVVLAVAATALAAWIVVRLTGGGPPAAVELVPGSPVAASSVAAAGSGGSPSPGPASPGATPSDGLLVVHVIGEVRRPGLVRLPPGSRVADAVRAAGGLTHAGSSGGLNLARAVADGEQVVVSPTAAAAPGPAGAAGSGAAGGRVDLNTATVADLDTLPGVGPVTAARILDWRAAHGRFASVDQLREVSGIGPRTFERLKPLVTV